MFIVDEKKYAEVVHQAAKAVMLLRGEAAVLDMSDATYVDECEKTAHDLAAAVKAMVNP